MNDKQKQLDEQFLLLTIGARFGYKECERGSNYQMMLSNLRKIYNEGIEVTGDAKQTATVIEEKIL